MYWGLQVPFLRVLFASTSASSLDPNHTTLAGWSQQNQARPLSQPLVLKRQSLSPVAVDFEDLLRSPAFAHSGLRISNPFLYNVYTHTQQHIDLRLVCSLAFGGKGKRVQVDWLPFPLDQRKSQNITDSSFDPRENCVSSASFILHEMSTSSRPKDLSV